MRRPLLVLAVPLVMGALVGGGLPMAPTLVLLTLSLALLVLALAPSPRGAILSLCGAALGLGAAGAAVEGLAYDRAPLRIWVVDKEEATVPIQVTGALARDPVENGERWTLVIDVGEVTLRGASSPMTGRVRVDVGGEAPRPSLIEGDEVSVWTQLRRPRAYATPGAFDTEALFRRQGIHAVGSCKSAALVERRGPSQRRVSRWIAAARAWSRSRLERFVLPGQEAALVRAMVLGDRTALASETNEAFKAAGTYHVLAISGAQVAFLVVLVVAILRRWVRAPAATAVMLCVPLLAYGEFVGGQAPVVRAIVMSVVLLVGRALDLDADMGNLLGLAGGVLLAIHPLWAGDSSFQLSFVGTAGLVLLTPRLAPLLPRMPFRLDLGLAASIGAQAALLPLLLGQFNRLAPAAVVLNLAAVPLSSAVLVAGLAVLVLSALAPVLAPLAGDVAWMVAHLLLRSAEPLEWWPWLDVRLPDPPLWAAVAYSLGLVLVTLHRRNAWVVMALGAAGLVLVGPARDGRLSVTVLDVGQGDAIVVRSPAGRVLVVDGGGAYEGSFDAGERLVAPFLWTQGVRRIDKVVLTHAHPDHAGGLPFLLRSFEVAEVWEGLAPRSDRGYAAFDAAVRRARVRRRSVARGVREDWDGVSVEVLAPSASGPAPWTARNDDSVVVALRFGEVSLLLAGDVEARGEAPLVGSGPFDVVKVAHHGSRSSSAPGFVADMRSRVAVVSVGRRNRFGHPDAGVLRRYEASGSRVLRTDWDGTVTALSDGHRLWVQAHPGLPARIR